MAVERQRPSRRAVLKRAAMAVALPGALATRVLAQAPAAEAITPQLVEAAKKEGKVAPRCSAWFGVAGAAALRATGTRRQARRVHAAKFESDPGKENGLYWPTARGQKRSPFGDLVAQAAEEGRPLGADRAQPTPFHGYYFKILTGQGAAASGERRATP